MKLNLARIVLSKKDYKVKVSNIL